METYDQANFRRNIDISISIKKQSDTLVPLGVANINHSAENAFFTFQYSLTGEVLDSLLFEIIDGQGEQLYNYLSSPAYHSPGLQEFRWDGFDNNDLYDSSRFNGKTFQLKITAGVAGEYKTIVKRFTTKYIKVNWLDIKIDRRSKKIKATIRTNFKDGGSNSLAAGSRSKSFAELLLLAIKGLQYHWGRNSHHPIAKNIHVANGDAYEFYLEVDNSGQPAIKSPKIVYQTNGRSRRSRNWELSRILFYNTGQLYHSGKWYFKAPDKAAADFKLIAAHEIGHEILLAFGGHLYSKTHKSSSTLLTQRPLGNFIYPENGEIDLMLYYADDDRNPCPQDYILRSVASEKDVLGLIWLSKIQIQ